MFRFALARGLFGLVRRLRAVTAVTTSYLLVMALGVWVFWGNPTQVLLWFVVPALLLAISPLVATALVVLTSEAWYYAPQPGQQAMLMAWHTRPGRRVNAGNFAAEPSRQGLGGTLATAWLADMDRRGLTVWITAVDDEMMQVYERWGFTIRKPGTRKMERQQRPALSGPPGGT